MNHTTSTLQRVHKSRHSRSEKDAETPPPLSGKQTQIRHE